MLRVIRRKEGDSPLIGQGAARVASEKWNRRSATEKTAAMGDDEEELTESRIIAFSMLRLTVFFSLFRTLRTY